MKIDLQKSVSIHPKTGQMIAKIVLNIVGQNPAKFAIVDLPKFAAQAKIQNMT